LETTKRINLNELVSLIFKLAFIKLVLQALDDLILKILICAAIISIVVNMIFEEDHRSTAWIEGAAIIMAVTVVSMVTSINDYKKES